MENRRDFLKKTSLLAGGAGIWSSLPVSIRKAISIQPDPGTTFEDAEHVVLLMQENRSFDHCFGTLQGVRGFNDPRVIRTSDGLPAWIQTNEKGEKYVPFRLNMKDTRATWMGGLPHSWNNQVGARNDGKYDKWLYYKKPGGDYRDMPLTMGYYNREDIPFYYSLADAFTICDQNFSSALTGTTANRSYFWSGTIRESVDKPANVLNTDTYYNNEAHWKTFPERLEENEISWKVYQNEISVQTGLAGEDATWLGNFTDNNLEWFANYNVRFHKAHYDYLTKRVGELPDEIKQLKNQIKTEKQNQAVKLKKILANKEEQLKAFKKEIRKWSPENFEKLTDFQKNIHNRAFTTNAGEALYHQTDPFIYEENGIKRELRIPKGDVLHQFRKDVSDGNLPMVSWIVAPRQFSDHPSAPWFGAWFVSEVLEILTKNPDVWKKTIFILNYDENDGYFDHQPPFTAPKPGDLNYGKVSEDIATDTDFVTKQESLQRPPDSSAYGIESPIGLGYRVPLIVASPWTRGGWVNSQVFDITSTIQFLEKFLLSKTGKNIKESNISEWRRVVTGDLTSVFRPYKGEEIRFPQFVEREAFVKQIYNAKFLNPPSGYRSLTSQEIKKASDGFWQDLLPGQEKGIRNACSLPYELLVQGGLTEDSRSFRIQFSAGNKYFGKRSAGAPFNVYAGNRYLKNGIWQEACNWAMAVKAGDEINYDWPLENFENEEYNLRVYGPNGFYQEFKGDSYFYKHVGVSIKSEQDPKTGRLTGNVVVILKNMSDQSVAFEIVDNSYGSKEQTVDITGGTMTRKVSIDLRKNFGWYDLTVLLAGRKNFLRRFAGRIETGRPSRTDPLLGRIS